MSELNQTGCAEFADVAAELALGALTGRERARALAHLDQCDACCETVCQLTVTGEGLVGLLPAIEPPAGFRDPGDGTARPPVRRAWATARRWRLPREVVN
jgi:hypothetical protein